jgi:hypothetical protein
MSDGRQIVTLAINFVTLKEILIVISFLIKINQQRGESRAEREAAVLFFVSSFRPDFHHNGGRRRGSHKDTHTHIHTHFHVIFCMMRRDIVFYFPFLRFHCRLRQRWWMNGRRKRQQKIKIKISPCHISPRLETAFVLTFLPLSLSVSARHFSRSLFLFLCFLPLSLSLSFLHT